MPKTTVHQTKIRILDGTFQCFNSIGSRDTNISDISESSGVSVGSIYHHFKNKENIYFETYHRFLEQMLESIANGCVEESDARPFVTKLCRAYLYWVEANPVKSKFIYWGSITEVDFTKERIPVFSKESHIQKIGMKIMAFVQAGQMKPYPMNYYEFILIAPLAEFSRRFLTGGSTITMDSARELLPQIVWSGVKGEPPAL